MGEEQGCFWEPTFNRSIKVRQKDDRLTGDAGLLLLREGDHRLGLTAGLAAQLRRGLLRAQERAAAQGRHAGRKQARRQRPGRGRGFAPGARGAGHRVR